jgi:hypothetical protein
MMARDWISLFGIIVGIIAFSSGLLQYMKAQKWKRAEFVANLIKEFDSQEEIQNTKLMLDWNRRDLVIHSIGFPEGRKINDFDDNLLLEALKPHTETSGFSDDQVAIRDTFDKFLDYLENFDHFIESGLVDTIEFKPYLIYWINLIGDENSGRKPIIVIKAIWKYIDYYGYKGVQMLFSRYGYDIKSELR